MDFLEIFGNIIVFLFLLGGLSKFLKRRLQTQTSSQHRSPGQTSHSQDIKTHTHDSATLSAAELLTASESETEHQYPLSLSSIPEQSRFQKQRQRRSSSAQQRRPASLLAFDRRRGYLKGIVLSEILGPPVSKRH
jgi:hypothetical protein